MITMSSPDFILNADKALENLVWNSIKQEPKAAEIVSSQEQISFSSPKAAEAKKTKKLSIFLYNVTQETAARNAPTMTDASGKRIPQTLFILNYLFTPCTGNEETDHVLLEKTIQTLAANPVIAVADTENGAALNVKLDSLSLDDLSNLWTALGAPLRLSASVTVASAELELASEKQAPKTASVVPSAVPAENVTELYQAVQKTFTEQSDGWKKRNMFQKQWVFQDFKKVTDMSVEDMAAALNSLGDKLERHASTSQFVKPLNALAEFYEHQLTELKGMQKFSKKQRENVAMVTQWIKDVKALAAALSG